MFPAPVRGANNKERFALRIHAMNVDLQRGVPEIVRVCGEIDLSNVSKFQDALDRAVDDSPGGFIIDMSNLDYIDSAGIQAIFAAYQRIRLVEGRIVLIVTTEPIKSIIDLVRPDLLPGMEVSANLTDAAAGLAGAENEQSG